MPFFDAVFNILIKPLELLFEVIFALSNRIVPSPAVNLIIMSLAINFIVLPLYRRADILQQEARDTEAKLRPMADHIRKSFKGDEKTMMLQTYYSQMHYNPLSSMKSIISLLLQIPFFIAAYQFLSHLDLLAGQRMGPIKDLLAPDGLIAIGGITINLLPILMTVINIVSSEIYTKGQPFKSKIVLYVSALVFLILLYDSPSGLVFYWTFNNLFSLVKNVFYKLKDPGFVFKILCAVTGVAGIVLLIVKKSSVTGRQFVFLMIFAAALIVPLALHFVVKKPSAKDEYKITGADKLGYIFSVLYLTFLTGFLIPSEVVKSAPSEFVNYAYLESPSKHVWYTLLVAAGVFVVWVSVFYLLSSSRWRKIFVYVLFAFAVVGTVDYLFFGTKLGILSSELRLEDGLSFDFNTKIINSIVAVVVLAAAIVLVRFAPRVAGYIALIGTIVVLGMGIINVVSVEKSFSDIKTNAPSIEVPEIKVSKNGKNVMVIMLDRAMGWLVPYIFRERAELSKQFDGFTYYPNTISFGPFTMFGSAGIFGGYEYTPEQMNARNDVLISHKQAEAMYMMPLIFKDQGYDVAMLNMPWLFSGNQKELTVDDTGIKCYSTNGAPNGYKESINHLTDEARNRNFFLYSIFKMAPVVVQPSIYSEGTYHSLGVIYDDKYSDAIKIPQDYESPSKASGSDSRYLNNRAVMDSLIEMTKISDGNDNNLFLMDNEATHQPVLLSEPDGYVPSNNIDNSEFDRAHRMRSIGARGIIKLQSYNQLSHYQVNMASYIALGKWFDYLKENGCWDNTRIIIVSDHARSQKFYGSLYVYGNNLDLEDLNCVLMVKDFNSTGFKTSEDFMTNADTAVYAMKDIISNPVNPFTGNPVTDQIKRDGPVHITVSRQWHPEQQDGTTYKPDMWYSVHDNIFDRNNWEYLGEY